MLLNFRHHKWHLLIQLLGYREVMGTLNLNSFRKYCLFFLYQRLVPTPWWYILVHSETYLICLKLFVDQLFKKKKLGSVHSDNQKTSVNVVALDFKPQV